MPGAEVARTASERFANVPPLFQGEKKDFSGVLPVQREVRRGRFSLVRKFRRETNRPDGSQNGLRVDRVVLE